MSMQSAPHRLERDAGPVFGRKPRSRAGSPGFRSLRLERLEAREMLTAAPAATPAATPLTPAQVAEETAIAQSINAFGLELYASLQSQAGGSGNTVFSPISISAALAMAYAGANGQTATQMANVLHFVGDSDAVEQEFGTLLSDLNTAGQGGNYTLSVADALWGQQGMQILAPFLQTMQSDFNGALKQVDFIDNPSGALQTINTWVTQETAGLITKLLSPSDVTDLTRLVLANAVYFKGSWASPFDIEATQNAPFTLDSGGQVQVSMMNQTSGFGYMDSDGFQVLDMPYAGGRLSMDVILPNQGYSAAGLNVSQLPANLTSWLGGLQHEMVGVSLPKFDITTQFELGDPLQALGMTDAFNPNAANFSGITDPSQLNISHVVHKATISVTETGTVAAAATGVGMTASVGIEPAVTFDADHPFLFLIRDDQSGAVLFMGQEMNPTSTTGDPSAPPVGTAPVSLVNSPAAPSNGVGQRERLDLALGAQETINYPTGGSPKTNAPTNVVVGSGDPGGTNSPPTTGSPGTGSGKTGSGGTTTPTTTARAHGSHTFAATDEAVSDFDLADLYALGETTARA